MSMGRHSAGADKTIRVLLSQGTVAGMRLVAAGEAVLLLAISEAPFLQMLTGLAPPTLSEIKLSTSTLPLPSAEDEMVAWTGEGQLRFSIVLLKVFGLLRDPVPAVESLTFAGPNSWMACLAGERPRQWQRCKRPQGPAGKLNSSFCTNPYSVFAVRLGAAGIRSYALAENRIFGPGGGCTGKCTTEALGIVQFERVFLSTKTSRWMVLLRLA